MSRRILFVFLMLAGCKAPCNPSIGCPTPASVRGQCMTERTCAINGVMGWCVTGDCLLERGKTLTVPVDALNLSKTQELFVDYRTHAAGAPDPTRSRPCSTARRARPRRSREARRRRRW